MTDRIPTPADKTPRDASPNELRSWALRLSADLLVPAVWVALIIAIVLFSGVVSQFRYVDF